MGDFRLYKLVTDGIGPESHVEETALQLRKEQVSASLTKNNNGC
jgi:hypothetical protein